MEKSTALNLFIQYGLPLLTTALLSLASWGLGLWIKHRMESHKDGKSSMLFSKLLAIMQMVVADVEQTLKPVLVAAAKDGVLTPAEWKQLRDEALKRFWVYIGDQGKKDITSVLGILAPSVEGFVGSILEAAVNKQPSAPEVLNNSVKPAVGTSPRP